MYIVFAVYPPIIWILGFGYFSYETNGIFSTILFVIAFFGFLDMLARAKDYLKIKYQLSCWYIDGSLEREQSKILRRHKYSWCQRNLTYWAFKKVYGKEGGWDVSQYYYDLGYRWYHIFPDHTFSKRSIFLKRRFWKNLIFGTD